MKKQKFQPKLLIGEDGKVIAVQLELKEYEALIEELEDAYDILRTLVALPACAAGLIKRSYQIPAPSSIGITSSAVTFAILSGNRLRIGALPV